MDIIFSCDNGAEVLVLPILSESMPTMEQQFKNEVFETNSGEINIIGTKALRTVTIESFFPVNKHYSFQRPGSNDDGWMYVSFFNRCANRRIPIRMVWVDNEKVISNMAYTIDSFNTTINKVKDIEYSLTLKEYRFVEVKKV